MNDILKTYMERFRENRHTLRRYTAFVLALAMITTLFVNWQLHGVGISMTAQYQCGEEEHTLQARVNGYLQLNQNKYPAQAIHRIDYETSGLVLFCKHPFFQKTL